MRYTLENPHVVGLFDTFDFKLLDNPDFREDSVREVLIVPLLKALGFSQTPRYRIIRSKRLQHPSVYIGAVKEHNDLPNLLPGTGTGVVWLLDAKKPSISIRAKNVQQAYSYAIHREIRVPLYGLCNGRKLVVYHQARDRRSLICEPARIPGISPLGPRHPRLPVRMARRGYAGLSSGHGCSPGKGGLDHDEDGKKYWHALDERPCHYRHEDRG